MKTYEDRVPFDLGPFRITPFLTDHSAFDAYSLLIEANGKRVFYSGDLRAHGRKAQLVETLIRSPPPSIDVLLLEGTTLDRPLAMNQSAFTEGDLEGQILNAMESATGLVLAAFSPQNIDRFVTIFRASRGAGRTFIADVYLAHLLDQIAIPSLPRAGNGIRVYLPDRQKRRLMADKNFALIEKFCSSRIFPDEIAAEPSRWLMLFRDPMASH